MLFGPIKKVFNLNTIDTRSALIRTHLLPRAFQVGCGQYLVEQILGEGRLHDRTLGKRIAGRRRWLVQV